MIHRKDPRGQNFVLYGFLEKNMEIIDAGRYQRDYIDFASCCYTTLYSNEKKKVHFISKTDIYSTSVLAKDKAKIKTEVEEKRGQCTSVVGLTLM